MFYYYSIVLTRVICKTAININVAITVINHFAQVTCESIDFLLDNKLCTNSCFKIVSRVTKLLLKYAR